MVVVRYTLSFCVESQGEKKLINVFSSIEYMWEFSIVKLGRSSISIYNILFDQNSGFTNYIMTHWHNIITINPNCGLNITFECNMSIQKSRANDNKWKSITLINEIYRINIKDIDHVRLDRMKIVLTFFYYSMFR